MKVFIGWSGNTSHQVALALRDWLPKVIQAIKPFVSSEDIAKGGRWSPTIAGELQSSFYGIICVTTENSTSPWINFEAGALSREIDKALVTPFLFGLKPTDIQGPLTQFQSTMNTEEEVLKLLSSINERITETQKLDAESLKATFELWWPKLKDKFRDIEHHNAFKDAAPRRETHEILEELLDTVRTQRLDQNEGLREILARQDILGQDQINRMTQISGLISALARSVESLHTEAMVTPNLDSSRNLWGPVVPGASGFANIRTLADLKSSDVPITSALEDQIKRQARQNVIPHRRRRRQGSTEQKKQD